MGFFYLCPARFKSTMTIKEIYSLVRKQPGITTDSRNVPAGSIFFAIKGESFDGNDFAADALNSGASFAIIDRPPVIGDDRFIPVNDVLQTLQELALYHRTNLKAKVIGITGSNGKTTTKELIGRVLATTFKTLITKGNLNNHIGVPVTLLSLKPETEFAVIEMGANHPGEIASLCQIARPDFGIITNIGKAHLEGFGSFEGVIRAKSELYDFLRQNKGIAFVNSDHDILVSKSRGIEISTYGTGTNANCKGKILGSDPRLKINWSFENSSGVIETKLFGNYNFENILAAICIGKYFNISDDNIIQAISNYLPENNRSQLVRTQRNLLILDAYNANPSSMKAAISNFHSAESFQKMIILGDMMELGDTSPEEHLAIVSMIRDLGFTNVVLIGHSFSKVARGGNEMIFPDLDAAEIWFRKHPVDNMTVLLKGSRKMQLERLSTLF